VYIYIPVFEGLPSLMPSARDALTLYVHFFVQLTPAHDKQNIQCTDTGAVSERLLHAYVMRLG